jgi:hypothetical protein
VAAIFIQSPKAQIPPGIGTNGGGKTGGQPELSIVQIRRKILRQSPDEVVNFGYLGTRKTSGLTEISLHL